jgi:DNA-binding response OmpR family regulator
MCSALGNEIVHPSANTEDAMPIRILVVDDERMIAETLSVILSRTGYECRTAYDGVHAIAVATEFDPHLIISDVVMPKMNGIELLRQTRKLSHPPRMMLISGNADTAALLASERLRGDPPHVAAKPIHPTVLLAMVADMIKDVRTSTVVSPIPFQPSCSTRP